jgi:hypothetical protein
MYHPYFRGKQYELITIRESAGLLKASNFVPIIEPVKQSLGALQKTIAAIREAEGAAIVIVNPHHGDHAEDGKSISTLLAEDCQDCPDISVGILLKENTTIDEVVTCCDGHQDHTLALIHAGFGQGKELASVLGNRIDSMQHVFFDGRSSKLYQKHFKGTKRVLIRDGFERRRGKDHPDVEFFSDLHATFEDEGMTGFGDFLMVGDDYSESGGPAYTVAIHITFIDSDRDDEMHIHHFKSDQQDTPTDPAGKFAEALAKLIRALDSPKNKIFESAAIAEFRQLHARQHFPGLGYVKKLSMNHHIETLANYFKPAA